MSLDSHGSRDPGEYVDQIGAAGDVGADCVDYPPGGDELVN